MASFDVLQTESNSGSFPSGDYSFLPEVSVHPVQNGSIAHINKSFDLSNLQSALSSTSPDISMEDVNKRLMELLDENRSLKDALNKNNLVMKDQMGTISAWRENMITSLTHQQQSLEKAKEKITYLEKENADLQRKLSNLEMECFDLKNQESCKNCESVGAVLQNLQKEKEAAEKARDILSREIGEFNNFHKQLRENLMAIYDHMDHLYHSGKLNDRQKEELKNLLICLRMKIGVLTEDFCSIAHTEEETGYVIIKKQQKSQTSEELMLQASTEIENLKRELEEKTKKVEDAEELVRQNASEIEQLRMNLEARNKKLDLSIKQEKQVSETFKAYDKKLQDMEKQFKSELEELNNNLETESTLARKYKERCQNLQLQIDEYQVKLKNASEDQSIVQLREESMNLQEILKLEQRANQADKEKLTELMLRCEKLQVDYDRVSQLLEIQSRDEKKMNEELTALRENGSSHMENADHLMAQVMDFELRLEEKEEDMKKLIEELVKVKEDAEMVPILQAQIDYYKTDLEHAVSTRDTAHAEIEKLEKDLRRQRR